MITQKQLADIHHSGKPYIIYKSEKGFDLYTNFSKKIILNNKNISSFLSHQIGSFFGAYLGGLFHDTYGSYDYAWYLAIALSVFAAIIHLPIKEEPVLRLKTE